MAGKRRTPDGRTPKLTPDVQKAVTDAVAAGVPLKYAAQRAGIDASTIRLWRKKAGKAGANRKLYVAFVAALKRAEADALARNVAIVQQAAAKHWTAAAWWLERRYPDEFAKREPSISVKRVGPTEVVEVVVRNATDRPPDPGPAPVPPQ